jgi:hypothetical protein
LGEERGVFCGPDSSGSGYYPVVGSSDYSNESSGSKKVGEKFYFAIGYSKMTLSTHAFLVSITSNLGDSWVAYM